MTLTYNEQREIEITSRIEVIKNELKRCQDVISAEQDLVEEYEKETDKLECELLSLVDGDSEEYVERQAEEINNQRDLENSQR